MGTRSTSKGIGLIKTSRRKKKEHNITNYTSNEAFKIETTKQIKPQIRPANCTV